MDLSMVGSRIGILRRGKGLTQSELGDRLGVSYQAVSKWERGETLPDTALLVDLADILETSVDSLLRGGDAVKYRGRISVSQMKDGILSLKKMGELMGEDHLLYRSALEGVNNCLHTDIATAFVDSYAFDAFLAEAVIQAVIAGKYVDVTDVKNSFQQDHFAEIVLHYCDRYGIK